ncbi:MAG: NAD(P)-binding domain-containing protein [Patescibacteria group bacterium]|nr:NAD(P)-binding domain-containing protein [Patescibacteria group bacterium]
MSKQITIIGCGNMGTAMAQMLAKGGHRVAIWCVEPAVLREIGKKRQNKKYLPDVKLDRKIWPASSLSAAQRGADAVLLAVPSRVVLDVLHRALRSIGKKTLIISVIKGLDPKSLRPVAEEILHFLPKDLKNNFVSMTGPAMAGEIARGFPTTVEIASLSPASSHEAKKILQTPEFKVHIIRDLRGAALCASLKNVYAILFGMAGALGQELNAKSELLKQIIEEMRRILPPLGGKSKTALSLSGLGDLLVTVMSSKSRNVTYGRLAVGRRRILSPAALGMKQTAEGYFAAPLFAKLFRKKKIRAPLAILVNDILQNKISPKKGLQKI